MSDLSEKPTRIYRRRAVEPVPHPARTGERATPPDMHVAVPAAPHRSRLGCLLLVALLGGLVFLASGAATVAYLYGGDRILPGVQVLGVPLGGKTVSTAGTRLQQDWNQRQIVLEESDQGILSLAPTDLGLVLDAEATAQNAYQHGRNMNGLGSALRGILQGAQVEPAWYFDPAAATARLETVARNIDVEPVNAGVHFFGGRVEATPSLPGRRLDVAATVNWLQGNAGQVVLTGRLPLVTVVTEPAITDVSAAVAQANELLTVPIQILAYDPVYDERREGAVPPEVWTGWLSLVPNSASPTDFVWEVDESQAAAYLEAQATAFGAERYLDTQLVTQQLTEAIRAHQSQIEVRLYHRATQHTVQPGETLSSIAYDYGIPYPWIQQANPALGEGLYPGQTITIPSPDLLLPLPVVEGKRIVVSISQQRMWAYESGALKWEWPVSTGIDSSPTAPGVFQVQSHEDNAYAGNWDLWMPNFMGIYQPVPGNEFMNGFHGFPTRSGQNLLWTNSLGRKVTYGCILVSNENITQLYQWAEDGVVVEVQR